jgi:transposase
MAIVDRKGLPVAITVDSASPHEVTLVEATLEDRFTELSPERLIGDRAYDSDEHDKVLREKHGVELISPHRKGRKRAATQDGRALRRYARRWKVERFFAWLGNYRRLLVRHEHYGHNFLAFVQLACAIIWLKQL